MVGQELIMIPICLSNVVLLLGGRLALDMGHSQKALTAQWVILRKHRRVTSGERRRTAPLSVIFWPPPMLTLTCIGVLLPYSTSSIMSFMRRTPSRKTLHATSSV